MDDQTVNSQRQAQAQPRGSDLERTYLAQFGVRFGALKVLLPAASVQMVADVEPPTRLPGSPRHIVGLVPHGEGAMAVVDVAQFLQLPPHPTLGTFRVVAVRDGNLEAGLLCQQAFGILRVARSSFQQASATHGGRAAEFLQAEVEVRQTRFGILNLTGLLEATKIPPRRDS